jgi:hypothetical protein
VVLDGGEGRMWAGSGDGWGAPAYLRRRYWAGADVLKGTRGTAFGTLRDRGSSREGVGS